VRCARREVKHFVGYFATIKESGIFRRTRCSEENIKRLNQAEVFIGRQIAIRKRNSANSF
jgi:hypothetical protein